MSDGYRLIGTPTVADLEELAQACRILEATAQRLSTAGHDLAGGLGLDRAVSAANHAAHESIKAAQRGAWAAADDVRALAARLRRAIASYADAESTVEGAVRSTVVLAASAAAESLTFGPLLGLGAAGAMAVAELVDPSVLADERASTAMLGAASFMRALKPGLQVVTLDPVPSAARDLDALLGPAGPTATVPVPNPPRLPVPRTVADVLANVGRSYDGSTSAGVEGTRKGVITVQQLTHPDGTRAWVIEVPGTEDWRPGSSTPLDLTTNLRLMGALPDDMSTAVVHAMRAAGIGADEPVMLAGHSQGGMAALAAAALVAPVYAVKAVVTAGSPDIPQAVPPGVHVRRYVHDEDLVPQLDGAGDRHSSHETVVRRDLGRTGGPRDATPSEAHRAELYAETAGQAQAALADDPFMKPFDDAAAGVLGPPGTTAVTLQFEATRDPQVVASIQPTIRPAPGSQ